MHARGQSADAFGIQRPLHERGQSVDAIATRLAAAKPVVRRGQGELLQVPWSPVASPGLWLVIDLCSGMGGILFALSAIGVRCIALCAESDPIAAACCQAAFPNDVHVERVADC